jgi:hypothetical protein
LVLTPRLLIVPMGRPKPSSVAITDDDPRVVVTVAPFAL